MRKITEEVAEAFYEGRSYSKSNTYTDGNGVWLHGNKIIERRGSEIWATWAGWETHTTAQRLNGILGHYITAGRAKKRGYFYFKATDATYYPEPREWVRIDIPQPKPYEVHYSPKRAASVR